MPVSYFVANLPNSFSSGAQAIAGYTALTVCNTVPIMICNPYETQGMTDAQATTALTAALDPKMVHVLLDGRYTATSVSVRSLRICSVSATSLSSVFWC